VLENFSEKKLKLESTWEEAQAGRQRKVMDGHLRNGKGPGPQMLAKESKDERKEGQKKTGKKNG